jgi:hypothetical protein
MRGSTPVLTLRQYGGEDVQSSVDVAVVNRIMLIFNTQACREQTLFALV